MPNPNTYIPSPKIPPFVTPITLQASESRVIDTVEARVLYVAEMVKFGTGAGDVSMSFGVTGEYFDLAPGDLIRLSPLGQLRLRNNTATAKSLKLILANDADFLFGSFPRGL